MGKIRKKYEAALKARIALEAVKGGESSRKSNTLTFSRKLVYVFELIGLGIII
ncbi:hypothetical protein [Thermodesulfovibrio thiophilus]|uniref:hypothetical protein n=1 Tax=Thermodesulfovibrio thiophilus TaxID=340095 RepID=UPI00179A2428|nr:hypothetical protein [Thermodesulfovibrio thiophilus]HHW21072.1 hypothetical protein [Thermodesulfovibrio thiophilus]